MKLKNTIILSLIILISISSTIYGFKSNYFLSGDLPMMLATMEGFGNFSETPTQPYLPEGNPDIHNSFYLFSISILKISELFSFHLNSGIFVKHIFQNVALLMGFGIICSILLPLTFFIMVRQISKDENKAVFSTIVLFLLVEIPLIRWAGIVSFHGMMAGSIYVQSFSLIFLFLSLFFYSRLRNEKVYSWNLLFVVFFIITFLSHLMTGLILFYLLLFIISLDYGVKYRVREFILLVLILLLSFSIVHLWPFFPVYEFIKLVIPYTFIILLTLLTIVTALFVRRFYDRTTITFSLPKFIITGSFCSLILFLFVLTNMSSGKTPDYLYLGLVNVWFYSLSYILLLSIFLIMPYLLNKKDNQKIMVVAWFMVSIGIYIIGIFQILELKVFWRFLFFAKIPASIILGYSLADSLKSKNAKPLIILIFVLIVSFFISFSIISNSPTASYFKDVPSFYSIQFKIQEYVANQLILSDPETSYHIASLTNNKVIGVSKHRVSDYDFDINEVGLKEGFEIWNDNYSCKGLSKLNIGAIVLNKYYSFGQNLESVRSSNPLDYSEKISSFMNCGYVQIYEDEIIHILLLKNETNI